MSHATHHPHTLHHLTPREAIADALYRALLGFDHHDVGIFNTAWLSDDVTLSLNGDVVTGLPTIRSRFLETVGPMDTTHMTSNVRIQIHDGAVTETASLTAYAVATHALPGKGCEVGAVKFTSGSEYSLQLVKDVKDEVWKIKRWDMKLIWTEGDYAAVFGTA